MLVAFGGPPSALSRQASFWAQIPNGRLIEATCPCTSVPAARPRGHLEGVHCEGSLLSRPSTARAQKTPPARARQRVGAARLRDLRAERAVARDGRSSRALALGVSSPFRAMIHEALEPPASRHEQRGRSDPLLAAQSTYGRHTPYARRAAKPFWLRVVHNVPIEEERTRAPEGARRASTRAEPRSPQ